MTISHTTRLDKSNLSALLKQEQLAGARSDLGMLWEKFDFDQAQRNVARLQARIVKAFKEGKWKPKMESRVRQRCRAFGELAPLVWKLTCPVLRGEGGREALDLPDKTV